MLALVHELCRNSSRLGSGSLTFPKISDLFLPYWFLGVHSFLQTIKQNHLKGECVFSAEEWETTSWHWAASHLVSIGRSCSVTRCRCGLHLWSRAPVPQRSSVCRFACEGSVSAADSWKALRSFWCSNTTSDLPGRSVITPKPKGCKVDRYGAEDKRGRNLGTSSRQELDTLGPGKPATQSCLKWAGVGRARVQARTQHFRDELFNRWQWQWHHRNLPWGASMWPSTTRLLGR